MVKVFNNVYNLDDDIIYSRIENILKKEPEAVEVYDTKVQVEGEFTEEEFSIIKILVEENIDKYIKPVQMILNEIWDSITSEEQKIRLVNAINKYNIFYISLQDYSYSLARDIMIQALGNGDIEQEDYDLVDNILPKE